MNLFIFLLKLWVVQIVNSVVLGANTLLTISMVTREALRILVNNLKFTRNVRHDFDDSFAVAGAKIGATINIRKPPRYSGRKGQALQLEDATETFVPLTLSEQAGVDIAFSSADLALSIDDFSDRFIKPNIARVANQIDQDGLAQFINLFNMVGTPGTVPSTIDTYLLAGQRLDEEAAPRDATRTAILSPGMQASLVSGLKGLFQSSEKISEQNDSGVMGTTFGFKFMMDQNVNPQVFGNLGGTPVVAGGGQTGNVIASSGWTANAAVLNAGDVITIAGVFAVNPQSKLSTTVLRNFVVAAPVVANGAGLANIPIAGPSGNGLVTAGPFQTVTASPANGAAITPLFSAGAVSNQGVAYHRDCFAMGCADLPLPEGVDKAYRAKDEQVQVSFRIIRAYDINQDRWPTRSDVLYGWTTLYPELGCRISS